MSDKVVDASAAPASAANALPPLNLLSLAEERPTASWTTLPIELKQQIIYDMLDTIDNERIRIAAESDAAVAFYTKKTAIEDRLAADKEKRAALQQLQRVNAELCSICSPLLWRRINLDAPPRKQVERLLLVLPKYAAHVRLFHLERASWHFGVYDEWETPACDILCQLQLLKHLQMSGSDLVCDDFLPVVTRSCIATPPPIESLELVDSTTRISLRNLVAFILAFSNTLTSLHIDISSAKQRKWHNPATRDLLLPHLSSLFVAGNWAAPLFYHLAIPAVPLSFVHLGALPTPKLYTPYLLTFLRSHAATLKRVHLGRGAPGLGSTTAGESEDASRAAIEKCCAELGVQLTMAESSVKPTLSPPPPAPAQASATTRAEAGSRGSYRYWVPGWGWVYASDSEDDDEDTTSEEDDEGEDDEHEGEDEESDEAPSE